MLCFFYYGWNSGKISTVDYYLYFPSNKIINMLLLFLNLEIFNDISNISDMLQP